MHKKGRRLTILYCREVNRIICSQTFNRKKWHNVIVWINHTVYQHCHSSCLINLTWFFIKVSQVSENLSHICIQPATFTHLQTNKDRIHPESTRETSNKLNYTWVCVHVCLCICICICISMSMCVSEGWSHLVISGGNAIDTFLRHMCHHSSRLGFMVLLLNRIINPSETFTFVSGACVFRHLQSCNYFLISMPACICHL